MPTDSDVSESEIPGPEAFWYGMAAVLGGGLWFLVPVAYGLGNLSETGGTDIEVFLFIGPPLLLVSIWGFYRRYGGSYTSIFGRGGLWALALGVFGLWSLLSIQVFPVTIGGGLLVGMVAGFGTLVVLPVGLAGFAVECWDTETPSRWMAVWFPLSLPVSVGLNAIAGGTGVVWLDGHIYAGFWGLAWVGFGLLLWQPTLAE